MKEMILEELKFWLQERERNIARLEFDLRSEKSTLVYLKAKIEEIEKLSNMICRKDET